MTTSKVIFIVGPTAVGKTDIAFHLAREINGEIISCDSMQVYKEIEIASSKPPAEMLNEVPHHLINVVSVAQNFDVASFNRLALTALEDIYSRGKVPIIAGGSGLYMQVLLDGIFDSVDNPPLREELKKKASKEGLPLMYEQLQLVDPKAAAKIHPNDARRIIRALEVSITVGRPISELQANREGIWGKYDIALFALNRDRIELYERINRRVDVMFEEGIIEEVTQIRQQPLSMTAQSIIGIKEISGYLDQEYDLQRAEYLMKLNTRHLAKRQLTWFRRDQRLKWVNITESDTVEMIMGEVVSFI